MFWQGYQLARMASAERTAESAESKVDRYTRTVDELQRQVERLSLACQAMWELLQSCSNLNEQDLENKILEVDARDGYVDGKIGVQQLDCSTCGRKNRVHEQDGKINAFLRVPRQKQIRKRMGIGTPSWVLRPDLRCRTEFGSCSTRCQWAGMCRLGMALVPMAQIASSAFGLAG